MENNETKALRVKQIIKFLGISNGKFADILKVDRSTMSKYLTGKQPITAGFLGKIAVNFPEINSAWVLTGVGKMTIGDSTTININRGGNISGNTNSNIYSPGTKISSPEAAKMIEGRQALGTPYYNAETAACGALSGFGEALTANNSDGCVVLPTLPTKNGDVFLQTRGRSMIDAKCPERSIPEGAMVLVRKWNHSFVEWGEIYCIVTTDGYVVKKLMPGSSEDRIKCVSADPENFPPYEISADEIKDIGRVIAVVSTQLI